MSSDERDLESFLAAPLERVDVGTPLAYRRFGAGPALVLVHGWPLCGATYRGLVRALRERFTCYVLDLPGAGDSPWDPRTRETFSHFGALLVRFVDALGLGRVSLVGHDSGGLIARLAAAELGERVAFLGLIDTELTGYTPPLVKLYQAVARMPGSAAIFGRLAALRAYRRSALGFGRCFSDLAHLDGPFHRACVEPILRAPGAVLGTLAHADFSETNDLRALHARIHAPTALVWGEQDRFFPVELARKMSAELPRCVGFTALAGQSLFVQDEQPDLVAAELLPHLLRWHASDPASGSADLGAALAHA